MTNYDWLNEEERKATNWDWIKQLGVSDAATDLTPIIASMMHEWGFIKDMRDIKTTLENKLKEVRI